MRLRSIRGCWDKEEKTRAFSKRFGERLKDRKPSMIQAGVYSAVLHYLKAISKLKSDADGKAVVAEMKAMPTDDLLFGKGRIRVDGRKLHPFYLYEVKSVAESKYPWDYYRLLKEIPADEAFRPLSQGECYLVTAQK